MSTQSQVEANQANAQLSTGPTTEDGKAISALNSFNHGLASRTIGRRFLVLAWENQDDYDQLYVHLITEYRPMTVTEAILVEAMAQHQWLRDRAQRLSDSCFDERGRLFNQSLFSLYLRYRSQHDRAFHKSLRELATLRAEKQKQEIGFASQKRQAAAHTADLLLKEAALDLRHMRTFATETGITIRTKAAGLSSATRPPVASYTKPTQSTQKAA